MSSGSSAGSWAFGVLFFAGIIGYNYVSSYYTYDRFAAQVYYVAQGSCKGRERQVAVTIQNLSTKAIESCTFLLQGFAKDPAKSPVTGRVVSGCYHETLIRPGEINLDCYDPSYSQLNDPRRSNAAQFDWKIEEMKFFFKK